MVRPSDEERSVVHLTATDVAAGETLGPGVSVRAVTTTENAREIVATDSVECIVVDERFDGDFQEAVETLRSERPTVPILVTFEEPSAERIGATLERGATDFEVLGDGRSLGVRIRALTAHVDSKAETGPLDGVRPLDAFNEGVYATDETFTVTRWNGAMADATDVDATTAVGSDLFDLFPELADSAYGRALKTARSRDGPMHRVRAEGLTRNGPTEVRIHPISGGLTVHELAVDPIDRRDARLLESALSDLFVDLADLLYFKDDDSRFLRVSESMAEHRDCTREELRGMSDFDLMSEEEARKRYEDEQRIMETGEVTEDPDEQLLMPSGDVEWYHSKKAPLHDEDGNVIGTLGMSREVTELRELEGTIAELEAIIDRVPVSLLAVDQEGRITWANRAAEELFAPAGASLVERNLSGIAGDGPLDASFMEQYNAAFDALLSDSAVEDAAVINDVRIRPEQDDARICDVHVRLLPLAEETFRGTAIAFHDVTEQVEQERVLFRQYDRLERLVETISHDLRNPLTVAIGKVEIAAEQSDDDHLQDATRALKRIETLIDDLLTMARLGRSVEDPTSVSIEAIATEAWQPFESEPAALIVETDAAVSADPDRLLRLFENLFRNAIEHCRDDVTVRVGSTTEGFFVADDGTGIDPGVRDDVFGHGFTTEDDGHGLGLSIVQEITSAHGWSIEVDESESGGARFDVRTTE